MQTPRSQSTGATRPAAVAATTASTTIAVNTAAKATHRNCSRSTPCARRKRTSRDQAATRTPRPVTITAAAATSSRSARAGTASGLVTDRYGCSNGSNAPDTTASSGAAAVTLAHHRQRGEGSDPVGVSTRMKLRHAAMGSSPTPW